MALYAEEEWDHMSLNLSQDHHHHPHPSVGMFINRESASSTSWRGVHLLLSVVNFNCSGELNGQPKSGRR